MHDLSRSNVSIENAPAFATMYAFGERFLGDSSALRTFLASSARVDLDELATGSLSLVAKHRNQCAPRGIVDMLGKHPASQALDVQILDGDTSKPIDDLSAFLVQDVTAHGPDMRLRLGNGGLALAPHLGAAFAPRQRSLDAPQFLGVALGDVGTSDGLAVVKGDQRGKTNVNPDAIRTRTLDRCDLDVKDDVPLPSVAAENAGLRFAGQFTMPADLDFTRHADKSEFLVLSDRHAVADTEIGGVISVAGSEPWKPAFLAALAALHTTKERLVCLVQFPQHLLLRGRRPAALMQQVTTNFRKRQNLFITANFHAVPIGVDPMFKTGIVELAKIRKHVRQRKTLRLVRFNAIAVRKDHLFSFLVFDRDIDGRGNRRCEPPVATDHRPKKGFDHGWMDCSRKNGFANTQT